MKKVKKGVKNKAGLAWQGVYLINSSNKPRTVIAQAKKPPTQLKVNVVYWGFLYFSKNIFKDENGEINWM